MMRIQMILGSDGSKAHYVLNRETILTISVRDLSVLYRADLLEDFFSLFPPPLPSPSLLFPQASLLRLPGGDDGHAALRRRTQPPRLRLR